MFIIIITVFTVCVILYIRNAPKNMDDLEKF